MSLIARDEQAIRTYVEALEDEREGDRVGERVLLGLRKEYDAALQRQRGAVESLRESAETLHRVSPWWEHAERSFEDCPADSCVKARAALGGR